MTSTVTCDAVLSKFALKDQEWDIVEQMVEFLEPFEKMTKKIS
ncbi:unnamed protein product, partial [Allacma fusca]